MLTFCFWTSPILTESSCFCVGGNHVPSSTVWRYSSWGTHSFRSLGSKREKLRVISGDRFLLLISHLPKHSHSRLHIINSCHFFFLNKSPPCSFCVEGTGECPAHLCTLNNLIVVLSLATSLLCGRCIYHIPHSWHPSHMLPDQAWHLSLCRLVCIQGLKRFREQLGVGRKSLTCLGHVRESVETASFLGAPMKGGTEYFSSDSSGQNTMRKRQQGPLW